VAGLGWAWLGFLLGNPAAPCLSLPWLGSAGPGWPLGTFAWRPCRALPLPAVAGLTGPGLSRSETLPLLASIFFRHARRLSAQVPPAAYYESAWGRLPQVGLSATLTFFSFCRTCSSRPPLVAIICSQDADYWANSLHLDGK
jgi:hypothetical protein